MSSGKGRAGGTGRLKACQDDCQCICHREIGNVTEHTSGYCPGKVLTNPPQRLQSWAQKKIDRNMK